MADIRLGSGNDTYLQPEADKNVWNNVYGEDGNDVIKMFQGTAIGGKGNDTFERLIDPTNLNRELQVAFWSAGDNLRVNLAEGWAEDGEGGRDTLIGITKIHGSGSKNALVIGDDKDNYYWPNGGDDSFSGGAGNDGISLNSGGIGSVPGQPWRNFMLSEMNIVVSADGRNATITNKVAPAIGAGFVINTTDVEYFDARTTTGNNDPWVQFRFADFITPQTMAEQAIAAGGSLRWNATGAMGSAVSVSYSFVVSAPAGGVGAPGFRAFTVVEQQVVRDILAKAAAVANISFTEVQEVGSNVGQLRFGVSQQAATKGVSWLPGQPGAGDQAGDIWMDVESMLGIAVGSEGYQALLHEVAHALGLRHPRNIDPGDAWATQLRVADDRTALSVMASAPSGDGLFRADFGPLDVLALRYLYGTKTVNASDTNYTLGATQGSAQTLITDDGGIDTLDASALATGVSLNLKPGSLSSVGQAASGMAGVDNLASTATSVIENAIGSAFDDVLLGNDLDNRLTGGLGNDWIDGGAGIDTSVYPGKRADYEFSGSFGKAYLKARDGVSGFDTLVSIERLQFSDQQLALAATPLASDVFATGDEDVAISASLPDPSDVARSAVRYSLVGNAGNGAANVSASGSFTYSPATNFWGTDSFTFRITAGTSSNDYMVFVNVLPINDAAPVARNATFLAASAVTLTSDLPVALDIDKDPITYSLLSDGKSGNALVSSMGNFNYLSKPGFVGVDSFVFNVSDGAGGNNRYTASVNVLAVAASRQGSAAGDTMVGLPGTDGLFGLAGNDRITGLGENDVIDGGAGIDTAVYLSNRTLYVLSKADFGWTVVDNSNNEGRDSLAGIERLQFANANVAVDLDGNAGSVAQIIRALFGKSFLANKDFVGIGLKLFDGGMAYADVVNLAIGTDLFAQLAGGRSNTAFVDFVYRNVVGGAPSADELAQYAGALNAGVYTQGSLGLLAAQFVLNAQSAELVGLAATGIEFNPQG